ncbi:immunoglobulin lambda-1 light chain-like [Ictalurus furcatus]|uniref:immunoglobulin lambda-1 light chain-like n=1 Tax=Ictalurus furcatus TaxID=66913 RepID=UPI002350C860|nr:immunoglobulin lambda-1 light chain-like [Ictalurus furcatus]
MMILNSVSVAGLLLLTLTGLAAYDLSQEKSKSAKEGDKVSILCTAENDKYYISWYQQKSGGPPEFLLCNDNRASGLPGRFTYTDSGNQDYLNIEGVRAEDEAVYYCACVNCGGAQLISDRPSSPPSLLLLAPSGSPLSEGDVSVMCVARGFYPDSVTMSWSENSSSVTGDEAQTGPPRRQADGTFSRTSVLKLSKQRWSSGRTYTCRLSHPALSTPLSQSTSLDECV